MPREKKRAKARKGQAQAVRQSAAVPKGERRKQRQRAGEALAYGSRTISHSSAPGLSITVQIPPLRRPKLSKDSPPTAKHRLLRPIVVVPVVVVIVSGMVIGMNLPSHAPQHVATVSAAKRTAPDYTPLVPSDSQTTQPSYDGTKNLVSYTTTFSDARVTVSEQPRPTGFTADGSALKRAADSINATQRIDTAHGPMYVAAADKDTGQMGIYANDSVLLFVHADKELDAVSWKSFIDVLQSKDWQNIHN